MERKSTVYYLPFKTSTTLKFEGNYYSYTPLYYVITLIYSLMTLKKL